MAKIKQKLLNVGVETIASSPAELAIMVKSEIVRLDKVIKSAGIHVE